MPYFIRKVAITRHEYQIWEGRDADTAERYGDSTTAHRTRIPTGTTEQVIEEPWREITEAEAALFNTIRIQE